MGQKVDLWLITVTIRRHGDCMAAFGYSSRIPEPDAVLCFHLCMSLLAYYVSVCPAGPCDSQDLGIGPHISGGLGTSRI